VEEIGIGSAPDIDVVEARVLVNGEALKYVDPTGRTYQTPIRENIGQIAHPWVNRKNLHY
jgi:hypothetical protein